MKKVLAIALIGIIAATSAITLAACGNSHKDAEKSTTQPPAATQAVTEAETKADATEAVLTEAVQETDEETAYQDDVTAYTDTDSTGEFGNYRSNSEVYRVLYNTIQESGANGYTICDVYGIDGQVLLLSHGEIEAERYYDVYQILGDNVEYIGQLAGSHTVAYIGNDGMLGMYNAHQGYFTYGPVLYDGSLSASSLNEGTISADESYPDVPGAEISFYAITDFSGIAQF